MNKSQILNWKNGFFTTLLLVAVVLTFLAPRAAVNVDEQLHYPHAKKVVNWYFTGGRDTSCLHTPETNLKYYGQSVDNLTALVNRVFKVEEEFLARHYTGALFFLLLLYFTGIMSRRLSGSWLAATLSVMALVLMPRLSGHAYGNLKDIPFAAGYMAGLLMISQFLKELPRPRWRTTILLGMAVAFTVSVRAGGLVLFAYLGLSMIIFFSIYPSCLKQILSDKTVFTSVAGRGLAIVLIGYFAGLLFWPYALQNVFVNPFESLRVMEHYKIGIRQLFEGELIWSNMLPWYYLPKWLLISTPGFVLTGFVLSLIFFISEMIREKSLSQRFSLEGFILFSIIFPVFYVTAIGSNLYSGIRQMLFILPPMAVLSTHSVFKTLNFFASIKKMTVYPLSLLFIILLAWPLYHQVKTFPVDYVYFNVLAGGTKKAWGNYEYDYYFHGLKEPAEYLIDIVGGKNVTVAMNCNLSDYFNGHNNITFQYTRYMERSSADWDYGLFGVNYIHPYLLKNNLWQPAGILKEFYHRGNPVAVLVRRQDMSDYIGISELNKLNLGTGTALLERALKNDPNNVWLHVNLAKARLAAGDIIGFEHYVRKGKEIHPFYEPFFLLEAGRLFDEGKYGKSYKKLTELFKINPAYQPAEKLYRKVKDKIELNQINSNKS
jgi:hypothetical protein